MQFHGVVTAKEKVAGAETIRGRAIEVLVAFSHSHRLLHQQGSRDDVGAGDMIEDGIETRHAHTGLEHHESA